VEENGLKYRRQFLLCRDSIPILSHWNILSLANDLFVYSHPDLSVLHKEHQGVSIVLLGYIFDPAFNTHSNLDILTEIMRTSDTFDSFVKTIKRYAGQFVFIYKNSQS
jgi:hypothetical protein